MSFLVGLMSFSCGQQTLLMCSRLTSTSAVWLWADFSLAVDGRLCWRSGQRLISFDCGLSLAGAATTIIFAATKVLSRQTGVCRDKARLLSRQAFLSRKTYFITKIFSRDKSYVPARIFLSRQKTCFVATNACLSWKKFCCDKNDACGSSHQW